MAQRCILFPGKEAKALPWKNGQGITFELAIWPATATFEQGDYLWRISKACIAEDGPFSSFAGFERILVVTSGGGVTLAHAEPAIRSRLRPLEPYHFTGDWRTQAHLTGGSVQDFNVIYSRSRVRAEAEVLRLGTRRVREPIAASQVFLHVLAGEVLLRITNEEQGQHLSDGDSILVNGAREMEEMEIRGTQADSLAILVRLYLDFSASSTP